MSRAREPDIHEQLAEARARGPEAVLELVRRAEARLLRDAARDWRRDDRETRESTLERCRARIRQARRGLQKLGNLRAVALLKQALLIAGG